MLRMHSLPAARHDASTGETSYPSAEALARSMRLPVVACPISKFLYGTTVLLLDEGASHALLAAAGHLRGTDAHEAAMSILRDRAWCLAERAS
jgi:hypothetical protein